MAPGATWVTVTLQPSGSQPGACLCVWTMSGDTFACYDWRQGATGDWAGGEARGAAEHPAMHRTALTTKKYSVSNVNS